MNLAHISNGRLATFFGAVLTSLAAALVATATVFRGGFEAQAAWGLALLPGELLALPLSDLMTALPRRVEGIAFWILLIAFSWPWYCLVSYILIKLVRRVPKTWDGF